MPEQEMHTTAFWLHFPAQFLARLTDLKPSDRQSGIVGIGNALRTVAALLVMCDPRDLGLSTGSREDEAFEPKLYLYDNYPGGIGQSAPLYKLAERVLRQTSELISNCGCEVGCPSCVGPAGDVGDNGKVAALRILREIQSADRPG